MKKLRYLFLAVIVYLIIDISRYFIFPDINELQSKDPIPTAFMQYRVEQYKAEDKNITLDQRWVPLDKISPYVIKAVLISEDDKFWKHEGFDAEALESAFEKNLKEGKFSFGGSTVSQQLSKNLYLSPSKNPIRKIKEAIITWRIEKTLSKKRIIELYLNIAEWGEGIFGIEAAARHYFKKNAKQLTALEAAKLAAVLPNPIVFNPLGNQSFVTKKSKRIYKIMLKRGIVIPEFKEVMQTTTQGIVDVNESLNTHETNTSSLQTIQPQSSEDSNQSAGASH